MTGLTYFIVDRGPLKLSHLSPSLYSSLVALLSYSLIVHLIIQIVILMNHTEIEWSDSISLGLREKVLVVTTLSIHFIALYISKGLEEENVTIINKRYF
ncbi:hypothetical protein H8356DRAFT_1336425 [Neocallimastix lanati (nom. inval.)]|nr:hypothetical protein H8356DRAFT_1336425 [Neocallimastix sp. JGI-2020a]